MGEMILRLKENGSKQYESYGSSTKVLYEVFLYGNCVGITTTTT